MQNYTGQQNHMSKWQWADHKGDSKFSEFSSWKTHLEEFLFLIKFEVFQRIKIKGKQRASISLLSSEISAEIKQSIQWPRSQKMQLTICVLSLSEPSACKQIFVTVWVFSWRSGICTLEKRDTAAHDSFIALVQWRKIRVYRVNPIFHKKHRRELIRVCRINLKISRSNHKPVRQYCSKLISKQ